MTAWKKMIHALKSYDIRTLKNLGIGKMLLLWFLAISLIPLAGLSFFNFFYYYQGLNILAKKSLVTTSEMRLNYLEDYFDEMEYYLDELSESLKGMEKEPGKIRTLFNQAWRPQGIDNIYFISRDGKILTTWKPSSDSGSSVYAGDLAATRFAGCIDDILQSRQSRFSDFERYAPAGDKLTGFFGKPVISSDGKEEGAVALRLDPGRLNKILQIGIVFGSTGNAFLVGNDLKLRASSRVSDTLRILTSSIDNEKTRTWQNLKLNKTHLTSKARAVTEEVEVFTGPDGKQEMGLYRNLDIVEKYGVRWALVESFELDEAHMVASRLSQFAKISLVLTAIMVLIISAFVTRMFVTPIKKIADWARQVAHGELVIRDIPTANNEVGRMKEAFNWLVNSLKSFSEVSQSVSRGDYSKMVTVRSEKDVMAKSMNEMVESFRTVVRQAHSIAGGDYSTNVHPRSEKDTLGIALFEMTRKLREASVEINNQDWLKTGINELGLRIRGDRSLAALSEEVVSFLCRYLKARSGYLYLSDQEETLKLAAYFAGGQAGKRDEILRLGEGLAGQAGKEMKPILISLPEDQISALREHSVNGEGWHFIFYPILFEGELSGVIELGAFEPFNEQKELFIRLALENISVAIHTTKSREREQELLKKTQEQAAELVTQAKALEVASNYKSEFLANMSHELRTPLNSILTLSDLLTLNSNNTFTEKELEFARVIHSSGQDLLDLINDILDLSKVEAGKLEIVMDELNPVEITSFVKSAFSHQTEKKGIYLKTIIEGGLPPTILSDSLRVRQIVKNLISNAIKFTQQGGITITIGRPAPGTVFSQPWLDSQNSVAIAVADTGIGIPKEKMKLIFEAFTQADETISRKFGGTGLGLTISKRLASLLGGELHAKSKEFEGSVFTLYLPLSDTLTPAHTPTPTTKTFKPSIPESLNPEPFLSGIKVLICDDDMRNVFIMTSIFEKQNANLFFGRNGQEGINKLNENPDIGILIIDIIMPVMDGLSAIKTIRDDLRFKQLPILVVSADAMPGAREKCLNAGADDFLIKPVNIENLLHTVDRLLHRS